MHNSKEKNLKQCIFFSSFFLIYMTERRARTFSFKSYNAHTENHKKRATRRRHGLEEILTTKATIKISGCLIKTFYVTLAWLIELHLGLPRISGQRMSRPVLTPAKSNHKVRCSVTESLDTVEHYMFMFCLIYAPPSR